MMNDQVTYLPSHRYCPNGHRWTRCRGVIDVDAAGYRAISCGCPAKNTPTTVREQEKERVTEKVTRDEWGRAHRQGYARIWDGRRYMLRLDPETGGTVWRPVEVQHPLIERRRREDS